jgi:hypothetical protein
VKHDLLFEKDIQGDFPNIKNELGVFVSLINSKTIDNADQENSFEANSRQQ